MLVGFGLDQQLLEPVEIHCYYTTGFLITLRRGPRPALDDLRQEGSVHPRLGGDPIRALHPVISSLYTQFSVLVLQLDERLDVLELRCVDGRHAQPSSVNLMSGQIVTFIPTGSVPPYGRVGLWAGRRHGLVTATAPQREGENHVLSHP